ncbi:hypothetical protein BC830DRAFT_1110387 [Chytriomyces sp. MP71]|nr:hypothetical protein BC830DRAFT_1110387 [Chytriomyces sp. MP71]
MADVSVDDILGPVLAIAPKKRGGVGKSVSEGVKKVDSGGVLQPRTDANGRRGGGGAGNVKATGSVKPKPKTRTRTVKKKVDQDQDNPVNREKTSLKADSEEEDEEGDREEIHKDELVDVERVDDVIPSIPHPATKRARHPPAQYWAHLPQQSTTAMLDQLQVDAAVGASEGTAKKRRTSASSDIDNDMTTTTINSTTVMAGNKKMSAAIRTSLDSLQCADDDYDGKNQDLSAEAPAPAGRKNRPPAPKKTESKVRQSKKQEKQKGATLVVASEEEKRGEDEEEEDAATRDNFSNSDPLPGKNKAEDILGSLVPKKPPPVPMARKKHLTPQPIQSNAPKQKEQPAAYDVSVTPASQLLEDKSLSEAGMSAASRNRGKSFSSASSSFRFQKGSTDESEALKKAEETIAALQSELLTIHEVRQTEPEMKLAMLTKKHETIIAAKVAHVSHIEESLQQARMANANLTELAHKFKKEAEAVPALRARVAELERAAVTAASVPPVAELDAVTVAGLEAERDALSKRVSDLEGERNGLALQAEDAKRVCREAEADADRYREERDALAARGREMSVEVDAALLRVNAMTAAAAAAKIKKANDKEAAEVENLRKELESARRGAEVTEKEKDRLAAEVNALTAKLESLQECAVTESNNRPAKPDRYLQSLERTVQMYEELTRLKIQSVEESRADIDAEDSSEEEDDEEEDDYGGDGEPADEIDKARRKSIRRQSIAPLNYRGRQPVLEDVLMHRCVHNGRNAEINFTLTTPKVTTAASSLNVLYSLHCAKDANGNAIEEDGGGLPYHLNGEMTFPRDKLDEFYRKTSTWLFSK